MLHRIEDGLLTHLYFDFFGTLVAYSASRTEQGYPRSHTVYSEAGGAHDYDTFLERWSAESERLDAMGVRDCFDVVVTSVEHGLRKPRTEIFRDALRRLDAVAERSVYVGDSFAADYQGARRAGMRAYLIDAHAHHDVAANDRLSTLWDLESRLDRR